MQALTPPPAAQVSVRLTTAEQWRVHYGFLFHVLDAQADPTQQAPQHQIENTASGSEEPE